MRIALGRCSRGLSLPLQPPPTNAATFPGGMLGPCLSLARHRFPFQEGHFQRPNYDLAAKPQLPLPTAPESASCASVVLLPPSTAFCMCKDGGKEKGKEGKRSLTSPNPATSSQGQPQRGKDQQNLLQQPSRLIKEQMQPFPKDSALSSCSCC